MCEVCYFIPEVINEFFEGNKELLLHLERKYQTTICSGKKTDCDVFLVCLFLLSPAAKGGNFVFAHVCVCLSAALATYLMNY